MTLILALFAAVSVASPLLTRLLSTRVFYVIALLPAAVFGITLAQTPTFASGGVIEE